MSDALGAERARLAGVVLARRVPSAALVIAERLDDGVELAEWLCGALLCGAFSGADRCGRCAACRLFDARSHPDLVRLEPVNGAAVISVSQIREATAFAHESAHQGAAKILRIAPAEAMSASAANALLKALEEPPESTWFILVSRYPSLLPATVRSRCQRVAKLSGARRASGANEDPRAAGWQALRAGKISAAALAAEWRERPLDETLAWLAGETAALARAEAGSTGPGADTLAAYDAAMSALAAVRRGVALNPLLALEETLSRLADSARSASQ